MEAASSAAFFDDNQLSNKQKTLVDRFKALCPSPVVSSINILLQAAVAPN